MVKEDFSKNEECLNWLQSEYVMLGRNIFCFLSEIESSNPSLLQKDECNHHLYNVIYRLSTIYKMVADLDPDEKTVFEKNLPVYELFVKNKLGLMTVSDSLCSYEKPSLIANQDFHPVGYPYPFSGWFYEKTDSLAESFVNITGFLFDSDRHLVDTVLVTVLNRITSILRELLIFFEHKVFSAVDDYSDSPFSIEEFFIHFGFGQAIMRFNPDSEYWKEMKAKKGVKKFLEKWDLYASIPREKEGRTLLYRAFENLGFKDIRIGELRRELDKVSYGEKSWEDFIAESIIVVKQLKEEPYSPWTYGYDSYQEQMEAEE